MTFQPDDLDRCVHGRHSTDPCLDCPGGRSEGNLLLLVGHMTAPGERVRIGTDVHAQPIFVTPVRRPRGEA